MCYRDVPENSTAPQPLLAPPCAQFQFTAEIGLPTPKPHSPPLAKSRRDRLQQF